MGRYYSWDIEGKFWFAVQSSDDWEFFWAVEQERAEISYLVDAEKLPYVRKQIQVCLDMLWENKKKLDDFFEKNNSYNDERLAKETDIPFEEIKNILVWYARLELGQKILKCMEEQGDCYFDAEI